MSPDDARQITDDDIRVALSARPQLTVPTRIAWFNMAPERDEAIAGMLQSLPTVSGTYRIAPLLVTGRRRYEPPTPPEARAGGEASLSRLRLIAARAQCDLVVVFDYGYRVDTTANAWVALNVLLLPVLFTPFLDTEAESYLDAYVIDVRNGYLYGHATDVRRDHDDEETIWSDAEGRLVDEQWERLLQSTGERLAAVLSETEEREDEPGDDPVVGAGPDVAGDRGRPGSTAVGGAAGGGPG